VWSLQRCGRQHTKKSRFILRKHRDRDALRKTAKVRLSEFWAIARMDLSAKWLGEAGALPEEVAAENQEEESKQGKKDGPGSVENNVGPLGE